MLANQVVELEARVFGLALVLAIARKLVEILTAGVVERIVVFVPALRLRPLVVISAGQLGGKVGLDCIEHRLRAVLELALQIGDALAQLGKLADKRLVVGLDLRNGLSVASADPALRRDHVVPSLLRHVADTAGEPAITIAVDLTLQNPAQLAGVQRFERV